MKKTIGLLIIVLFSSVSAQAGTDPNRWDGFRGIKWGTNIKDINDPDMTLLSKRGEIQVYIRPSDKPNIGDANVAAISYVFYKDRFYMLGIQAKGQANFTALKDAIFAYYGPGKQLDEVKKEWTWLPALENSGNNVRMELNYNQASQETVWVMIYLPINQEKDTDDAKRELGINKDF